jgi:hypothetical protein
MARSQNLGLSPGPKNKPIRGIAFEEGKSELPGIGYPSTALGKFNRLKADRLALIKTYEQNRHNQSLTPIEKARLEGVLLALKLCEKDADEAFELGRDNEKVVTPHRSCPDCLPKETPLLKNKQYCEEHRAERDRISTRLAMQRQRAKRNVSNVSKKTKGVITDNE